MGLLFGKKKNSEKAISKKPFQRKELKRFDYILSSSFRGYKKAHITSWGYGNYQKNLDSVVSKHGDNFKKISASFIVYTSEDGLPYAELVIDGLPVGAVFSTNEYYEQIVNGKVEAVFIRHETKNILDNNLKLAEVRNQLTPFIKIG